MTSEKKFEGEGSGPAQHETTSPGDGFASHASPPPGEAPHASPPVDETVGALEVIARLQAEAADLKDRLVRAHAEMENVRKRLEKEKAETARFAITKFARDVVGIGDNVQRAIDAVPHQAAEHDPALKSFLEGVTMIEREFINVLDRYGVKRIDPTGEVFNPHLHQAVMEMPVTDVPSGTVTQVFQPGYMIDDRILRPAMVVVAKGGMKPQSSASPLAGSTTTRPPDNEDAPPQDNGASASPDDNSGDVDQNSGSRRPQT